MNLAMLIFVVCQVRCVDNAQKVDIEDAGEEVAATCDEHRGKHSSCGKLQKKLNIVKVRLQKVEMRKMARTKRSCWNCVCSWAE